MTEEAIGIPRTVKERLTVLLFVPNIIDLTRLVLSIAAFIIMPHSEPVGCLVYWLNFILDYFDGTMARHFRQVSKFGALFDMVLDRVDTTLLIMYITTKYPAWTLLWQFLVALDISSHVLHIQRQVLDGKDNHKDIKNYQSPVLRIYYKFRPVLGVLCTLNELFYTALILYKRHVFFKVCFFVSLLGFVAKQVVNCVQLVSACLGILDYDIRRQTSEKR